jgi:hypothetical protein
MKQKLAAFAASSLILIFLSACGNKAKEENHYHYKAGSAPPGTTSAN